MNKDEFLLRCKNEGYCRSKTAKKYAKGKDVFTEDDIISVFRMEQQQISAQESHDKRFRNYQGARCTKRLIGGTRAENPLMHNHD